MVNVNTVYKTVLYLLNKQQRGYITPDEFNKTSTQVQLEMFEKYFDIYLSTIIPFPGPTSNKLFLRYFFIKKNW